jgi:hypothetical protein
MIESLSRWQQILITRLEEGLGRALVAGDMNCIAWNRDAQTLTVESSPLLREVRSKSLLSNVFRSPVIRR